MTLNSIKTLEIQINDQTNPLNESEIQKISYTGANTAAMEKISRFRQDKTCFQKIIDIFIYKPCRGFAGENTDDVNPKIYDLIDYIEQNCYSMMYLFFIPCWSKNYKALLHMIRRNEDDNFKKFSAIENVSALKMYLQEDLGGLLSIKTTRLILNSLLPMGAEGDETLKKHGKYLIERDRLILHCKILTLFVKISNNIHKTKSRYDDLVTNLTPYILPVCGISNFAKTDLLKIGKLICYPYDLKEVESVLRTKE